jgi:hypothetical protein
MRYASILLLLMLCGAANAQSSKCPAPQDQIADAVIDYLDSWKNVAMAFRQFKACDDGAIAEGLSEAVARLLADHWEKLRDLTALAHSYPGLEDFVVLHLDETISQNDAAKIADFARHRCPASASALCRKFIAKLGAAPNP